MDICDIVQFRNALMCAEDALATLKPLRFEQGSLMRTKYFAECRVEVAGREAMLYAPITPTSMDMARCAFEALHNTDLASFVIINDEMLCTGIVPHRCSLIVDYIVEGSLLSEALYTHERETLESGLAEFVERLQRYDVSINHLHPDSIIVDGRGHWHIIRPYYATRGAGCDNEAIDIIRELIAKNALTGVDSSMLHEGFSPYGTLDVATGRLRYAPSEGMRRFDTLRGTGYEDERGVVVIDACYLTASDFLEDRAVVETINHKWGVIDRRGRYIVEAAYDAIEFDVETGNSRVVRNGEYATFDYFGVRISEWTKE